jgi:hypothetical protein
VVKPNAPRTAGNRGSAPAPSVAYRVRVIPAPHELHVEMTLGGPVTHPIRLERPTWVPGAYSGNGNDSRQNGP